MRRPAVCPFYSSRADIRPSEYVNPLWAVLPPDDQQLDKLFQLGYTCVVGLAPLPPPAPGYQFPSVPV